MCFCLGLGLGHDDLEEVYLSSCRSCGAADIAATAVFNAGYVGDAQFSGVRLNPPESEWHENNRRNDHWRWARGQAGTRCRAFGPALVTRRSHSLVKYAHLRFAYEHLHPAVMGL